MGYTPPRPPAPIQPNSPTSPRPTPPKPQLCKAVHRPSSVWCDREVGHKGQHRGDTYSNEPREAIRWRHHRLEIEMTSTIHWTGDNWEELITFVGDGGTVGPQPGRPTFAEISTLAGLIVAEPGDRIIRDEQGRLGNLGQP